jgi:ubiquinone/menaquinone biosynthesis C-methylase UbiE
MKRDPSWKDSGQVTRHYGQCESGPTMFDFREPKLDWYGVVLDSASWSEGEAALDAGCGGGGYLPAIRERVGRGGRVVGLDITFSLLQHTTKPANPATALVAGSVNALPFPDASFDKILSAHMLYVVPSVRDAVAEFRRVLRPGGVLLAVTNSERDGEELAELLFDAGLTERLDDGVMGSFILENGAEQLSESFEQVETVTDESSALVIPTADVLVRWADRWRETAEPLLRSGVSWSDYLANVESIATERIEREGAFICRERHAMFVCS